MPSTYTTNNGLEKIGTGEQSGTWGDTTNLNFDIVDQALDGLVTVTATDTGSSGSPNTLPITDGSVSDGRNRLIIITDGGDLGGSVYYQLTPADAEKIVFLRNSLSGSRDLILFQGTYNSARDLIVPAGKDVVVKFSGTGTSTAVVAPVFADLSLDAATIASADINGGTIDGVTIGVTSVATVINVDNLKLDGNTLSSTNTNGNVVLAPNGDGDVQLDADTVRVGDSNNDVTITTNGTGDLTLNTNSGTDSGSIEIQDGANTNIIITADGTGKLELANGDITTSASSGSDAAGQDLTIQAGASTGNAAGGDMVFQTTPAGAGSGTNLNSYTTVLTLTDDSKMQIGTSTAVNSILDEDDMNSDSATALATQQSIKKYVDDQVATADTWSEVLANGATSGSTDPEIDSGQKLKTNTIEETTADAGVKVDTFTLKDNEVSIDATSGTDTAGTSVTVNSGQGTGTGVGGELLFKVAPAGSAGTSVNALATGMKLDSTKALYVDTINELTSAAGVTIDSVLLKDDVVNATDVETSTISANDGTTAINIADSTGAVDIDTSLNVDGTVTADGLTVDGDITATGDTFSFTSANAEDPLVILKNTTNDANCARLRFVKDKGAAGVDGDDSGEIEFYADNDAQQQTLYARIKGEVQDASDGAEGGRFKFQVASHDGEMITALLLADGNLEDEVDVVIGSGSGSLTEVSGNLNVNGTVTSDGLSVEGDAVVSNGDTSVSAGDDFAKLQLKSVDSSTNSYGVMSEIADVAIADFNGASNDHKLVLRTNDGLAATGTLRDRVSIARNGNISFFEDQGSTAKFYWSAANESLGIGTDSPDVNTRLHIKDANTAVLRIEATGTDKYPGINLINDAQRYDFQIDGATDSLRIYDATNSVSRFVLDTSGNIKFDGALVQDGVKATTTATTQVAIDTFAHASHDGAKVVITAATSADTYVTELLIATNGTTAVATEYGQIGTGSALATYDVDISGADVRILATPASTTSTTFRVAMTLT